MKGKDITLNLEVDFMEAVNGCSKTIQYAKTDSCGTCKGSRAKPGTGETTCGACGGSGMQTMRQGPIIMQTMCGACNGEGRVIRSPCLTCNGKGQVQKRVKETVNVPKGVNSGINLRMNKKGHYSSTGPSGDLMLKITVKPHSYFRRDGFDVLTDAYISVTEAILGGEVTIKTLSSEVKVKVDPGTSHNSKKKLLNLGIQKLPPN